MSQSILLSCCLSGCQTHSGLLKLNVWKSQKKIRTKSKNRALNGLNGQNLKAKIGCNFRAYIMQCTEAENAATVELQQHQQKNSRTERNSVGVNCKFLLIFSLLVRWFVSDASFGNARAFYASCGSTVFLYKFDSFSLQNAEHLKKDQRQKWVKYRENPNACVAVKRNNALEQRAIERTRCEMRKEKYRENNNTTNKKEMQSDGEKNKKN